MKSLVTRRLVLGLLVAFFGIAILLYLVPVIQVKQFETVGMSSTKKDESSAPQPQLVRINRLTGSVHILDDGEWVTPLFQSALEEVSDASIEATGSYIPDKFYVFVDNYTPYHLNALKIIVRRYEPLTEEQKKEAYPLTKLLDSQTELVPCSIKPFSSGSVNFYSSIIEGAEKGEWSWTIDKAYGRKVGFWYRNPILRAFEGLF